MLSPVGAGAQATPPPACSAVPTLAGRIAGIDLGTGSAVPVLRLSPTMGPLPSGIRLSGVLLPVTAGETGRKRLADSLAALIGANVSVEVPPPSRLDRYGRMTGLVRLPDGETLQARLLANGNLIADGGNATCWNDFVERESQGRREKHGIWSRSALITAMRDAKRLKLPDFVLLQGRVLSMARAGRSVYLNFGANRYAGPTVRLTATALATLAARGVDVDSLAGRRIEARGWAVERKGLLLTLDTAALVVVPEGRH